MDLTNPSGYGDRLKDPRWQKRCFEAIEDAGWECEECSNANEVFHVHHRCYISSREPWAYSRVNLLVLCESCHQELEVQEPENNNFSRWLNSLLSKFSNLMKSAL